jgi:glycosyltransferase involved in cell wall biosynthesis
VRILHVASGRLFGGIERMLATLAASDALAPGLESSFALCARGRASEEIGTARRRVDWLGDARLSRPGSVWRARTRLRQLMGDLDSDVVVCHAPWAYALFAPVARHAGTRVVWWQHDAATGRSWIERWARRTRADLVISNSRWTSQSASAVQPGVRVEVIHCPVIPAPPLDPSARRSLRATLATDPVGVVVLSAARLEPWKGHTRLLRALAALRDLPAWTLWVAGGVQRPHEAEYLAALHREAASLGIAERVRWLGERRDVGAVMASADLLCQANITPEPFGVVFAEALLGGIPVVTTDHGGAPEIVSEACGRLVPAGDEDALIGALRELICDAELRRALGAVGPEHALSRCAPSVIMPRLANVFESLTRCAAA